jgi:hypothetical protein
MDTTSEDPKGSINYQKLWDRWFVEYADILNGVPMELPPLREVNHWIPLINEGKRYTYHMP